MSWLTIIANLLAILSLVALGLVVLLVVAWFLRRGGSDRLGLGELDERAWLTLATVVAGVAMAGSLYFSEVVHFVPCQLCWYQRIAMYPQVLLLGMAALRRDIGIRPYAMAMSLIGAAIALYHVIIQRFPSLSTGACSADAPCTAINLEVFGFVTIPFLALSAFLLIFALLLVARPVDDEVAA